MVPFATLIKFPIPEAALPKAVGAKNGKGSRKSKNGLISLGTTLSNTFAIGLVIFLTALLIRFNGIVVNFTCFSYFRQSLMLVAVPKGIDSTVT